MTDLDSQRLQEILLRWLRVDSTSGREREFLEVLEQFFRDHGWNISRQEVAPERWNLVITDDEPTRLFFSTHVDTVPPMLPVRIEDGLIYGRGACDTKGGLLAMWAAAEKMRRHGFDGLGFLLVVGEEVDHIGARHARDLHLSPERIILCEPTKNRVVRAQKGMVRLTLRTEGLAGHSAFPGDGRSAVDPLLDTLETLRRHDWPEDELLGPTTLNIGVIEAGVAANVFAPSARAELLFRAVAPVAPMIEEIEALVGGDVHVEDLVSNDPVFFEPPADVRTCTVPFNTDATYLGELGPVWLVGPGDIRCAHSDEEHIAIEEVVAGTDLYEDLVRHHFTIQSQ